jgi:hypothetical protein
MVPRIAGARSSKPISRCSLRGIDTIVIAGGRPRQHHGDRVRGPIRISASVARRIPMRSNVNEFFMSVPAMGRVTVMRQWS